MDDVHTCQESEMQVEKKKQEKEGCVSVYYCHLRRFVMNVRPVNKQQKRKNLSMSRRKNSYW